MSSRSGAIWVILIGHVYLLGYEINTAAIRQFQELYVTSRLVRVTEIPMASNKPTGDNAREGAVKKRTQRQTKIMGEKHWTKRSKVSGKFMAQKKDDKNFKGVRREA